MFRFLATLPVLAVLTLLALACNGGDGETTPGPGSPAAGETLTATPAGQPSPGSGATETPAAAETPTADGSPSTLPTPEGSPAVAPFDVSQLADQTVDQQDCQFDPATAVVDCGVDGLYAANPIPTGDGISCTLLSIEREIVALRCSIENPFQTIYYAVE